MPLSRRRFLTIAAGSAALAVTTSAAGSVLARPRDMAHWRGTALGAEAEMLLPGKAAGAAIDAALKEIERLEGILSLYRPDSALSRLNATGRLDAPPLELVEVLSHAQAMSRLSDGAFDVTVQPLWEAQGRVTPEVLALVGWQGLEVSPAAVRLARPGMKVTLNGIAQGYVTDRVATLLRGRGYDNVLIDLGEARALGPHPDGRPWRVAPGAGLEALALADGALATSAPGDRPHIFDPATGRATTAPWQSVTVRAASAMQADALSTTLSLRDAATAQRLITAANVQAAWLRDRHGATVTVRG